MLLCFLQYLGAGRGVCGLTKELLSLVRQLRHQGMRVVISTQGTSLSPSSLLHDIPRTFVLNSNPLYSEPCTEPTVIPPVLLDLCGVLLLHRFSSPAWLEHVAKHVSADLGTRGALDRIVRLQVRRGAVSHLPCWS